MNYHYEETSPTDDAQHLTTLNDRILQAEEDGDAEPLDTLLTEDFTIVRAGGAKQDKRVFLEAVEANAHRGRIVDQLEIHPYGNCAVVTCRVTTSQNKDGAPAVGPYWNTRVFIRQEEQWRCATWQVTETREVTGR